MRLTRFSRTCGFTLLEVMAAAGIFTVLIVLMFQVLNGINVATSRLTTRIEAEKDARVALDTLAQDIYALVRNNQATILFKAGDEVGNDAIKFLCLSRPEPDQTNPRMTLVTYSVDGSTGIPMLVRGTAPVLWNDTADYDFSAVLTRSSVVENPVAEGVFRFEIIWLRTDGVISRNPPAEATAAGDFERVDLSATAGFIVTVASLDPKSRVLAEQIGYTAVQSNFSTLESSSNEIEWNPLEKWTDELTNDLQPAIRQNVRFIQRTYRLP